MDENPEKPDVEEETPQDPMPEGDVNPDGTEETAVPVDADGSAPETEMPEEAPPKEDEPEEKKSNIVPILLGLILVVLVVGGGIWLWRGYQDRKEMEAEKEKTAMEETIDNILGSIEDLLPGEPADCIASDYDGKTYKDGESYTSGDDCQKCTCSDGKWNCKVDDDCLNRPAQGCTYNGTEYNSGQEFDAGDGCNTCTCDDGSVDCTTDTCESEPEAEAEAEM